MVVCHVNINKALKDMKTILKKLSVLLLALWLFVACGPVETEERVISSVIHPEWSVHANIYEVNIRQYTPEGTFEAFLPHLDRLQDMGVDILWFMPIQPIGEKNRKGTLGSYYSIANYTAANPEFGTLADFRRIVDEAHARGMYVILDWVANHTAWDHYWTESNPDYYALDGDGNFMPPNEDWSDVLQLDYDNHEMRDAMIGEMLFWVEEIGIDGFRCDVAYLMPTDFWNKARTRLEAVKPVYMLAEAETPELHLHAFEAGYGWRLHHIMNRVASGEENVEAIDEYFFVDDAGGFPYGAYKMYFITNHDENSWAGTEFDRLGDGVEAFAVLTATVPGTILVYSGQEAGFDRMLEFFEKDQIDWGDYAYHDFYKTLLGLKHENQALWNGDFGGEMLRVHTNADKQVFAFVRKHEGDRVFVVLNLSDQDLDIAFEGDLHHGSYTEAFSGESYDFDDQDGLAPGPWGYRLFSGK